jgi:hypothetical protein
MCSAHSDSTCTTARNALVADAVVLAAAVTPASGGEALAPRREPGGDRTRPARLSHHGPRARAVPPDGHGQPRRAAGTLVTEAVRGRAAISTTRGRTLHGAVRRDTDGASTRIAALANYTEIAEGEADHMAVSSSTSRTRQGRDSCEAATHVPSVRRYQMLDISRERMRKALLPTTRWVASWSIEMHATA